MTRIRFFAALACLLSFLALTPARAAESVSLAFTNNTSLEFFRISLYSKGGGHMSSGMHVVPGNTMTMGFGVGSPLDKAELDMGPCLFSFSDLSALAGRSEVRLSVALDAENTPVLKNLDKPDQIIKGTLVPLAPENATPEPFAQLLGTKSVDELLKREGVAGTKDGKAAYLTTELAGTHWLAYVEADTDADSAKLGPITLRTAMSTDTLEMLLQHLYQEGFRTWYMQVKGGPDMEEEQSFKFPRDFPTLDDGQQAISRLFIDRATDRPSSMEALLIPASQYDAAVAGNAASPLPVYRIHCSNSDILEVIAYPNGGALVKLTR